MRPISRFLVAQDPTEELAEFKKLSSGLSPLKQASNIQQINEIVEITRYDNL